jgi:hypothetical protein
MSDSFDGACGAASQNRFVIEHPSDMDFMAYFPPVQPGPMPKLPPTDAFSYLPAGRFLLKLLCGFYR